MNNTKLWSDGAACILYTESAALVRQIRGWNAYKDGRIRDMGEYYRPYRDKPFAIQFRMDNSLKSRVAKAAGIKVV